MARNKQSFVERLETMTTEELKALHINLSKNLGHWSSPRRQRKARRIEYTLRQRQAAARFLSGDPHFNIFT